MPRNTKIDVLSLILLLLLAPFLLGFVFGTHYVKRGLEAIGLTPLLEAIFNYLGMNG